MKIALVGDSSNLSKKLLLELNEHDVCCFSRSNSSDIQFNAEDISLDSICNTFSHNYDCYIFNIGFLQPRRILEQSKEDVVKSLSINALYIIRACEYIFNTNQRARVFIIGSESGRKGSYDTTYFLSKSMLRSYVKQRRLKQKEQQIVLFSPSTIEDSRMTQERVDTHVLDEYRKVHPKGRFLYNNELVRYIADVILNKSTYLTNCEIEVNGGKFSRMH